MLIVMKSDIDIDDDGIDYVDDDDGDDGEEEETEEEEVCQWKKSLFS
jgi:hypothetical protein